MNPLQPNDANQNLTSLQAAEAFLEAEQAEAATFDMEALARSSIARQMGFDFEITIERNRFICRDKETGYKTTAFYTEPMDMRAVKRLVRALARLKKQHDSEQ